MIDAPIGFAFAAGLVAAFNPCGFAMLPAYLSFYVGQEAGTTRPLRALAVGGVVTAGFAGVFGLAGILIAQASLQVQRFAPWLTVVIGLALVPLGVAMLLGYEPKVSLPRLSKRVDDRGMGSMFVFGVSYAVVSLSCTLPVFLAAVATTFDQGSFASGMAVFGAYAVGMGLVLMVLTVAIGLAQQSLVRRLRGFVRYVNRAAGALLVVAGSYVAYYGYFAIRQGTGQPTGAGPIDVVGGLSATVTNWVQRFGPARLGVLLVGAVVVVAVIGLWLRGRRVGAEPEPPVEEHAST